MWNFLLSILLLTPLFGQTSATLRGVVTDDSGALVPGAVVRLSGPSSKQEQTATSNSEGGYAFVALTPGDYTLQASAPGLAMARPLKASLKAGPQTVNLQLKIATISEKVNVSDSAGASVSTESTNNASALVLRGDDLDALSDDPTSLEEDLLALAGPAAGPNGGSIFVDGFSGGQIPSKDSIREIRINQNPFSPEYDRLGFGRVEIFTKPGSDKYRGSVFYNFGSDWWNSRNPYAAVKAPFTLKEYGGNFGGPVGKKASFFADVRRDATDNSSILNGVQLDPTTLAASPFNGFYVVPQRMIRGSGRFDIQLSTNNTLTGRYAGSDMDIPGAGVGSFSLASRGYDVKTTTHTVQLSDTTVIGATAVNEVRFQYFHINSHDQVFTPGPALQVAGSFSGGGANVGNGTDSQSSYELQEYVSVSHGKHTIRFGVRLRGLTDDSFAPQNFNGTFSFNGASGVESIEQYRRTLFYGGLGYTPAQIRAQGGGASQFTINSGDARVNGGQFDMGLFAGDDWRVKPNLTVSLGARYETQTNIHDLRDFAPRLGFAWAPSAGSNRKSKTVIRGGFGMFYDRFSLASTLAAERYNGTKVQQYVVTSPDFYPTIPTLTSLQSSTQIVQKISGSLRAPYIMQSALGVERQLPANTTIAITYANSHGLHVFRSRDINAPFNGLFPYGASGPVFLMESAGIYNQNQLIVNVNTKVNKNVSLNGSYMLNKAMSNTDGLGTFPANQYALAGEYGPASTDVRQRATLAGSVNSRWNIRVSPLMVLQTGPPFDITSGQDSFGTTLFNARPGLATDPTKPGVIRTAYGLLDPNPTTGETIIGRNYGRGPGLVRMNLRVAKTFGFGQAREGAPTQAPPGGQQGGGPGQNRANTGVFSGGAGGILGATPVARRYNLIVSMQVENLLNHNNPGPIIGNITSPLFGRSNQPAGARDSGGGGFSESANNRRLELQVRLNF